MCAKGAPHQDDKEMGIKLESVYRRRFALAIKAGRMIREDIRNDRPNRYR
jgi:hypothetical protein